MKRLIVVLCVFVGIFSSTALAFFGAPYWTTDKAEATVFNSKWADDHNVNDLSCQGASRPHVDAQGNDLYKYFQCDVYYTDEMDYYGTVDCQGSIRVSVISDSRFRISNQETMQNDNCFISG